MTIQIDSNSAQFNLRLERVFGTNSKTAQCLGDEATKAVKQDIEDLLETIKKEITREVKGEINSLVREASKEILGNNAFSRGVSNALNTAVGQAISGSGLDARTIANSAARAFTPLVDDVVRKSSAQAADEFSSLFGLAQRNS